MSQNYYLICELGIEKNLKADMYFQNSKFLSKILKFRKMQEIVGFSPTLGSFFGAKNGPETDRKIRLTAQL